MDAERFHQIDRLFATALDLPEAERAAFLAEAAGKDYALRRAVDELLVAEVASRGLDGVGLDELAAYDALDAVSPPARFGPYRPIERVGQGGMADVYLAEREDEYRRRVAIKVIRREHAAGGGLQERFHRERQILARLEHRNIAALYDGGTLEDGRPWLAMEWIDGRPIDAYCDEEGLGVDARLDLFLQLCDAVEHAHRHLLVHRDLKPANTLVTEDDAGLPVVKLLDFGIAKPLGVAAEEPATRTGQRPMSPAWASPEQVRGDEVTTASDVYGLGVLLYALLAGVSPYRLDSELPHELESAILNQQPRRPSAVVPPSARALRRRLAGDLDAIVARAIEKDPARRYGSVAELAADVRRHLGDEPVLARRAAHRLDAAAYRAGKLLRRHRLAVAAIALVVTVLAGALIVVTGQARQLAEERDRAERTLGALTSLFEDGFREHGNSELGLRDLITAAAVGARRELPDQPAVRAQLLTFYGDMLTELGEPRQAEAHYQDVLAMDGDAELEPDLRLEAAYGLGVALHRQGKLRPAAARFSEVLALIGDRPTALRVDVFNQLSQVRAKLGDRLARDHLAQRALDLLDDPRYVGARDPADRESLRGDLSFMLGDLAGSVAAHERAYEANRRRFGEQNPRTLHARCEVGATSFFLGRPAEAAFHLEQAFDGIARVGGDRWRSEACNPFYLASARLLWRDARGAEVAYWQSLDEVFEDRGYDVETWATTTLLLASALIDQDIIELAEALLAEGLDLQLELHDADHPATAAYHCALGEAAWRAGRLGDATQRFEACDARYPESSPFGRAWVDSGLGRLALAGGDVDQAVLRLGRAFEVFGGRADPVESNPDLAEVGALYGDALVAAGRLDEAEPVYRVAAAAFEDPLVYCDGEEKAVEVRDRLAVARSGPRP